MDGACRLTPAKNLKQEGIACVHAGRHGEAGQEHQRQKHERHDEISELLQHVVALGLVALRKPEPDMLPYRGADMFQLAAARCEILSEMAAYQAVDQIGEPVDNEEPGEEEVPAPPGGEVAVAGQGHRPGKASNL